MQVEILGSGGALSTPRPLCLCRVCIEARERGIPYRRTGPSLFVHGPNILIDTPEEIKEQLNRSLVREIAACLYSHWHPDHVAGLRVWESLNGDFWRWPRQPRRTDIYLPQQVAADFREKMGYWEHLTFLERVGYVRPMVLTDGDVVTVGQTSVTPFRLAQDFVYAFLLEEEGKRLLVAPDELRDWRPSSDLRGVDLAVLPMGLLEFDPFTGERRIPAQHSVLKTEATFDQTLDIVRALEARHVVLTHIEEPDGQNYDDCLRLADRIHRDGLDVSFAFDSRVLDV